jgi:hypothetical protein
MRVQRHWDQRVKLSNGELFCGHSPGLIHSRVFYGRGFRSFFSDRIYMKIPWGDILGTTEREKKIRGENKGRGLSVQSTNLHFLTLISL